MLRTTKSKRHFDNYHHLPRQRSLFISRPIQWGHTVVVMMKRRSGGGRGGGGGPWSEGSISTGSSIGPLSPGRPAPRGWRPWRRGGRPRCTGPGPPWPWPGGGWAWRGTRGTGGGRTGGPSRPRSCLWRPCPRRQRRARRRPRAPARPWPRGRRGGRRERGSPWSLARTARPILEASPERWEETKSSGAKSRWGNPQVEIWMSHCYAVLCFKVQKVTKFDKFMNMSA